MRLEFFQNVVDKILKSGKAFTRMDVDVEVHRELNKDEKEPVKQNRRVYDILGIYEAAGLVTKKLPQRFFEATGVTVARSLFASIKEGRDLDLSSRALQHYTRVFIHVLANRKVATEPDLIHLTYEEEHAKSLRDPDAVESKKYARSASSWRRRLYDISGVLTRLGLTQEVIAIRQDRRLKAWMLVPDWEKKLMTGDKNPLEILWSLPEVSKASAVVELKSPSKLRMSRGRAPEQKAVGVTTSTKRGKRQAQTRNVALQPTIGSPPHPSGFGVFAPSPPWPPSELPQAFRAPGLLPVPIPPMAHMVMHPLLVAMRPGVYLADSAQPGVSLLSQPRLSGHKRGSQSRLPMMQRPKRPIVSPHDQLLHLYGPLGLAAASMGQSAAQEVAKSALQTNSTTPSTVAAASTSSDVKVKTKDEQTPELACLSICD